jgi:CHASE2 domain-containing sensor protein
VGARVRRLAGIVLAVGIVFIYGTWPEATPPMFATLVSGAIVLGYIAWRRYFS